MRYVIGITEDDIQMIAQEKLDRFLTQEELELVCRKIHLPYWTEEIEIALESIEE
jgi:hypothetical protein